MTALALPTRRDEAWRYSDLDAVASVWPVAGPRQIIVAAGETAHEVLIQDAPDGATAIHSYAIDIAEGGSLSMHVLNSGGRFGRIAVEARLAKGAQFHLNGAIIGSGEQTLEIVTEIRHAEPDAISRQTVRTILGNHATGSYLGKVAVERGAQHTDAEQSMKAMLLDRTATANAKPELEIFADDVKCAHGATVGELDKQALFYMASRGMDPSTARTLLLRAFISGLFDDIEDEQLREQFDSAAMAKLEAMI